MGRNSVDATKACRMRAVCAVRSAWVARLARLVGLWLLAFDFAEVDLAEADFFPLEADLVLPAVDPAVDLVPLAAVFRLLLADCADDDFASSAVCPATGNTIVRLRSKPGNNRSDNPGDTRDCTRNQDRGRGKEPSEI